jgi:hypothetical protein
MSALVQRLIDGAARAIEIYDENDLEEFAAADLTRRRLYDACREAALTMEHDGEDLFVLASPVAHELFALYGNAIRAVFRKDGVWLQGVGEYMPFWRARSRYCKGRAWWQAERELARDIERAENEGMIR